MYWARLRLGRKWTFSPTRPSGPSWSSSRDVCLFLCFFVSLFVSLYLFSLKSPFYAIFFKASHWSSDHMTRSWPLIGQPSFPAIWWWCTSSHLKSFLEPAVPLIRLFLMINMMPLKGCVVKRNYFTALLRNEARNKISYVRALTLCS